MKKEILKKRQEIFKIKLENFINKYGRRPKSGEGFSEGELKKCVIGDVVRRRFL